MHWGTRLAAAGVCCLFPLASACGANGAGSGTSGETSGTSDPTLGSGETSISTSSSSSSSSTDASSSSVASDSTTTPLPPPCETWCDSYPVNPGCDEGDDGVIEGDGSGGAEDTGMGMGDDVPLLTSVQGVHSGEISIGRFVQISDVVVTSPVAALADGSGGMFTVAAPEGGPFSGLTVRTTNPGVITLVPGDQVTVVGEHQRRYLFSLVEALEDGIVVNGKGTPPPPVVVTREQLETFATGGPDADALESSVVRVLEPEIDATQACIGELQIQSFTKIDDRFLAAVDQSLPVPTAAGYSAIVGPLLYTYNGFEIAPRSQVDFEE